MKKLLLSAALLASGFVASQGAIINVTTNITTNTTWNKTNVYDLETFVYVKNNATLTINKGTLIRGDKATRGSLIITTAGTINAIGTANEPIVFTSEYVAGTRQTGDWGGIIILGEAPINVAGGTTTIEGGLTGDVADRTYGGANPTDNSGTLRFIQIHFAGIAFSANNEINSLTMGGVGSGTDISYIQVTFAGDDSYEWFGGTNNAKYLIALDAIDDDFDTDFGYVGLNQFLVTRRSTAKFDVSGSTMFESDNNATGTTVTPKTSPVFTNVTGIGPKQTIAQSVNALFTRGAHLRRHTEHDLFNSYLTGYPIGITIDNGGSVGPPAVAQQGEARANFVNGLLKIKNTTLEGMVTNVAQSGLNGAGTTGVLDTFYAASNANDTFNTNANVQGLLVSPFTAVPDFQLQGGSPLANSGSFADAQLADPFFTPVNFRGAFGDIDWTQGWADWNPINTAYDTVNSGVITEAAVNITGTLTYCVGGSTVLTATAPNNDYTFQWYRNNVLQVGQTNASVTVTQQGNWRCEVTHPNGYTGDNFVIVSASPAINATATNLSSSAQLCNGIGTLNFSAAGTGATAYQWTKDGVDVLGATASTFSATSVGVYRVRITNANGCTDLSNSINVTNFVFPTITMVRGCSEAGVVRLTSSVINPNYAYNWTFRPTGNTGAFNTVGTGASYSPAANGQYRLLITNTANGCTTQTAVRNVPVSGLPVLPVAASAARFDYGLIGDVMKGSPSVGVAGYLFAVELASNPGVIVARASSASSNVLLSQFTPALQYNTTYTIRQRVIAANGDTACFGTARTFGTVSQATPPSTKLIASQCGSTNFNVGQMKANLVPGADNYNFVVVNAATFVTVANVNSANGQTATAGLGLVAGTTYKVAVNVTRDNVTTPAGAADTCTIVTPGGGGSKLVAPSAVAASEFVAYPNPFNTTTTLVFTLENNANVSVELTDLAGRVVYSSNNTEYAAGINTMTVNGEALQNGLYIARLVVNGNVAGQVRLTLAK